MTSSRFWQKRPRFNGSPSDHAPTEQWLSQLSTGEADGTTYELSDEPPAPWRPPGERFADPRTWHGANDIGVMAIATFTHAGPAPLDGYQPAPPSFPALPAAPGPEAEPLPEWERDLLDEQARQTALPVLRAVPVTEPAVIGDDLRLPVIWCEMPDCISWGYDDTVSAGFGDSRRGAIGAGWRYDALGRLACTTCQQTRPDYDNPQPVAWHHPEVRRRWQWDDPAVQGWWESGAGLPASQASEEDAFRLGVEAELGRRVSHESPALARAIAGATARTEGAS